MSQFGILAKFDFLQTWASYFISGLTPAVTHNLGKYMALHKAFYLSAIDGKPRRLSGIWRVPRQLFHARHEMR